MNLDSHHPGQSRRRAIALGSVVTLGGAAASWLLLQWSIAGATAATAAGTVLVSQGFPVLIAALASLACAAASGLSALGVLALYPTPHSRVDRRAEASRGVSPWGPRAAAVLLALTLSAPAAHATSSSYPPSAALSATGTVAAASAMAADTDPDPASPPTRGLPGWSPTTPRLPSTEVTAHAKPSTSIGGSEPTSGVVVTRGDTLWDVAASALGQQATNAEIAAHWPAWYEKNRHIIGPNPHLLLPGQILQPPSLPGAQP